MKHAWFNAFTKECNRLGLAHPELRYRDQAMTDFKVRKAEKLLSMFTPEDASEGQLMREGLVRIYLDAVPDARRNVPFTKLVGSLFSNNIDRALVRAFPTWARVEGMAPLVRSALLHC